MNGAKGGPAAFILKGYPRLSETFIAQEILGLEQAGMDILIVSMRRPADGKRHPVHECLSPRIVDAGTRAAAAKGFLLKSRAFAFTAAKPQHPAQFPHYHRGV